MIKLTAREKEVLEVIEVFGVNTRVDEIAELLNISNKNVSSYLTYLRNKGYAIPRHKNVKAKPVKKIDNSWLDKYIAAGMVM